MRRVKDHEGERLNKETQMKRKKKAKEEMGILSGDLETNKGCT